MAWNLCTIDWVAIGSVATGAMAIATFYTLSNNKKQFKELQKQNIAIQKQSFESTLFQLLHEVKRLLGEVSNKPPECINSANFICGLSALESGYNTLKSIETRVVDSFGKALTYEPSYDNIDDLYLERYDNMSNLGSYFRSLYRVIKYIDESRFSDEEKYQYTSFVRAQLTDIELLWLFYNCTVGYGKEKFKPLIEEYTLLKNMPTGRLVSNEHKNWINSSALERKNK